MGKLIVFEGIDGSGKSTQFDLICDKLEEQGQEFRRLRFPRYEEPSSMLIRMYLGGDFGKNPDDVNAYAASSFFAADRYASFVQDWGEYYKNGGLVLTDRYTTSNALHQGAKMENEKRKLFFDWLYDYEFKLIQLPKPDFVFYMNIPVKLAAERLSSRQEKTGTHADIHEQDLSYLESCAQSGLMAAKQYGWFIIDCVQNGQPRSTDDIHGEIYERFLCPVE
ncbi:MAG: thymidylate kinase [Oscillospiraceae bacterium]|nr:thymidylate kinase [Oscillospiraceae bacterium]